MEGLGAKGVVERAKQERLEREMRRNAQALAEKQQAASVRIAKLVRAHLARRRASARLRLDWDCLVSFDPLNTANPQISLTSDLKSAAAFYKAVGLFLLFFDSSKDVARLLALCKSISANPPRESAWSVLFLQNSRKNYAEKMFRQLLWICLQRVLDSRSSNQIHSEYLSGPEFLLLVVYGDLKRHLPTSSAVLSHTMTYLLEKEMMAELHNTLINRMRNILSILSRKNRDASEEGRLSSLKGNVKALLHISFFSLYSDEEIPESTHRLRLSLFVCHILSTPTLLSTVCDEVSLQLFSKNSILARICSLIISSEEDRIFIFNLLEGEGTLFFLGNLTDLFRRLKSPPIKQPLSPSNKSPKSPKTFNDDIDIAILKVNFIRVATVALNHCKLYVSEKATNRVVYHAFFEWYSGKSIPNISANVFSLTVDQLALFWNRQFVTELFEPLTSLNFSERQNSTQIAALIEIRDICDMYLAMTLAIPKYRNSILSTITYAPDLISYMWRSLQALGPKGGTSVFLEAAKNPEKEHFLPVLELFCETLSIRFLTLDNEEIYETQKPFRLEEIANICSFLNSFCFSIYWNADPNMRLPHILEPAKKLLVQLYDRNSRRPFGEEDQTFLVAKEVRKPQFIEDVRNGDERALSILHNMPQCIPFKSRGLVIRSVEIFRLLVAREKATLGNFSQSVTIHRNMVLEDGFRTLHKLTPQQFKQTIRVKFISKLGLEEAGIDQSGVFKEFLEDLCKGAFSPDFNLFKTTDDGMLYPSPTSFVHPEHLDLLEFFGRVLGKALYEGITIDIPFALFMYGKLRGSHSLLDDLPSLDPELYKNLIFLKHYEGDCEDLGLNFTIDLDVFGEIVTKEIKLGGRAVSVTNENKYQYQHLVSDFRLNQECKDQYKSFLKGFRSIISEKWLRFFSPPELQKLPAEMLRVVEQFIGAITKRVSEILDGLEKRGSKRPKNLRQFALKKYADNPDRYIKVF
ncbi:Ubiquitin-protein ligase E3B [Nowakowskiella sp. JEL0078]|nr:Ubiquitin-protein ligase E3B [Nowakowskiella sp. JEL0078]